MTTNYRMHKMENNFLKKSPYYFFYFSKQIVCHGGSCKCMHTKLLKHKVCYNTFNIQFKNRFLHAIKIVFTISFQIAK